MSYSNFHTHTTFCDGKHTPEEMVAAAVRAGCPALGFSGHAYTPFDASFCMSPENTLRYRAEVTRLKEAYEGKLRVLCGLEQDVLSVTPDAPYDYLIGAVHYISKDGCYLSVDASGGEQDTAVRELFGGDYYAYTTAYYNEVARVYDRTGCDIVAHLDLVAKFNEGGCRFDEDDRRYRHAALGALEALAQAPVAFEINTGAIRRGYRSSPYPAPFLLKELARRKLPVILSADAHDASGLLFRFDEAAQLAQSYGLTVLQDITDLNR